MGKLALNLFLYATLAGVGISHERILHPLRRVGKENCARRAGEGDHRPSASFTQGAYRQPKINPEMVLTEEGGEEYK